MSELEAWSWLVRLAVIVVLVALPFIAVVLWQILAQLRLLNDLTAQAYIDQPD